VLAFCEILRSHGLDATSLPGTPVFACIGPVTGQAARAEGLKPMVIASQYDTQGLIQALLEALREVVRE
jgi:uroporphyrinogen-III synthase